METSAVAAAHQQKHNVTVAVNIRPLIPVELQEGSTDCITGTPPQVQIGSHVFTFDHVYGSSDPSPLIFEQCVNPLIDALFNGYNATVLAYGQTGSGKTYTMGTDYSGEGNCVGIIPQVMDTIFRKVDTSVDGSEFLIRLSFIEIYKEKVFDLLDANQAPVRLDASSKAKASAPGRVPLEIRKTSTGGITLAGVTVAKVNSKEEMASHLTRGSLLRATASTNINRQSSRSHAIFTIHLEQKRASGTSDKPASSDYDILSSKFHLVDLAGSERAKRTGVDGLRLTEGIHINKGLLALVNVISALGDEKKRNEGAFVPYRDSKLTRLLQDSIGGNSKTVMIACISPADINAEETINTLKYANRARNIQNKAVVNREMQKLRSQLKQQGCSGNAALEELQVSLLELKNSELNNELKQRELSYEQLAEQARAAQLERDQKLIALESQVHELKKKQEVQQLQKQNQHIKSQDVFSRQLQQKINQLQQKIKQESKKFRSWKSAREKEVLRLEKEERRKQYEMHKLLALNQRRKMVLHRKAEKEERRKEFEMHKLKMVLHRKTEEAATARKRLKELLDAKKSSRIDDIQQTDRNASRCQVLDKEVICNEKEHTISELTEKMVLNSGIRQPETQMKDLSSQNTLSCACSKSSSCKTKKCECRSSGAKCGAGCGCKDSKCSNRDSSTKEKANQVAMPLQNVFSEKEAQDARPRPRKPLTEIGGNAVNQSAETKKPRKNWHKSTVQLVPG